jgi:hypothetical protein
MLSVTKYYLALISSILAIILSSISAGPNSIVSFKLKPGVNLGIANEVELKSNWQQSSLVCTGIEEIPCNISVNEAYTHFVGTYRILNSTGLTISIQSENGYLDQGVSPPFQYKRIASGTNYTFLNQAYY